MLVIRILKCLVSPHIRKSNIVLDSGFHAVNSGFQVLDSSLCQWNLNSVFQSLLGFRTPWAVFRIPKPRIPDSTDKNSRILKSWFPYMGWLIFSFIIAYSEQHVSITVLRHILVPVCWYCRIKLLVSSTKTMWPHIKIPFLPSVWNQVTNLAQ